MASPAIVAVVSGRNRLPNLKTLLPVLAINEYKEVVYLDDGSSDGSAGLHIEGVTVIHGRHNGPSLNRNRILDHLAGENPSTLLHFLDADVKLVNPDESTAGISGATQVAHSFEQHPDAFCIGGPVYQLGKEDTLVPMPWTYGPLLSPRSVATGGLQLLAGARHGRFGRRLLRGWPHDGLATPQIVGWVADANFAITLETLRRTPFDPHIIAHAAQTFGQAALQAEREIWFEPSMPAVVQTAPQQLDLDKIRESFSLLLRR
ncbi:glycosyltransferase family 2 protein [Candidatus Saccharibacteria bacterium]|nr:MAG: glycosyltransferase family 2 protein [Candidatus Saccharibacteria bacterium]